MKYKLLKFCKLKAYDADRFVFGSPTHYAGMSGNLVGFMDRLFFLTPTKLFILNLRRQSFQLGAQVQQEFLSNL